MALRSHWKTHESFGNDNLIKAHNMKTPIEYIIVAVPFHADAATHDSLAQKVNEKLSDGYELFGTPFVSSEMMYQAITKPNLQAAPLPPQ